MNQNYFLFPFFALKRPYAPINLVPFGKRKLNPIAGSWLVVISIESGFSFLRVVAFIIVIASRSYAEIYPSLLD